MKLKLKLYLVFFISSMFLLSSCASTTLLVHQSGFNNFTKKQKSSVLVLWGTAWRKNQKEPQLREEIASKTIASFFSNSKLFSEVKVLRTVSEKSAVELSDIEALNFSKEEKTKYDKIIFLRVEELGPLFNLNLSPILFEGATEVKLRVRVLDTNTTSLDYDIYSEWKNGGPFVIKGIKTLGDDMYENLKSIFEL